MGTGADARFEEWYLAQRPRVLAALTVISGHDLAVEGTDEAFARAFERWARIEAMTNPTGWVYRVAVNHVRRVGRRRLVERRLLGRPATARAPSTPEPTVSTDDDLWRAVGALPDRQRMAFVLRHVADLPEAEVASIMGITRGAVSSAASKARSHLAESLGEPVHTEGPE